MTVYTTLPTDDLNLAVEVTESNDMVTLNITPASVNVTSAVTSVNTLTGNVVLTTANTTFISADSTDTLTNKSGSNLQWTNDAGYITNAEDDQTLSFVNPDLTISNGNTVDITMYDQTLNTTDDVTFNSVTADMYGVQHFIAKAREAISAGQPVYISGHSGNTPEVMVADYTDPAKMPAFGIASADIANNNNGDISTAGDLINVDTTGTSSSETWAVGDNLYVNGSKLTNVRPQLETQAVQSLAKVIRVHANNGQMFLSGAGRINDTPNLDHYHVFIGNAGGVEERQLTYTDILNTPTIPVDSVNGFTGAVVLTTTDINEGTNEYYTNARADARVDLQTGANLDLSFMDTDDLAEGPTKLYYTDGRVQTVINTNSAGFITSSALTPYSTTAQVTALPVSTFTNDAGYLTTDTDSQTLSFTSPNLTISNSLSTVDLGSLEIATIDGGTY